MPKPNKFLHLFLDDTETVNLLAQLRAQLIRAGLKPGESLEVLGGALVLTLGKEK